MYKFSDKQMGFEDFDQPIGLKMNPENRWVKKAALIPWDKIEKRYATLFPVNEGQVAKPLRLALGALIIKQEYGYSDEETAQQIRENPYLQYFVGLPGYRDELPFDPSSMVHFRKRLTPEILGEINELIIAPTGSNENTSSSDDNTPNNGTLILDATCVPVDIAYPQDIELLNKARENLEEIIDLLHDGMNSEEKKPRTYRQKARKDYLFYAKKRKLTPKQRRKGIGKQLRYIRRDIGYVEELLRTSTLSDWLLKRYETIQVLYAQQLQMYGNATHRIADRIVSLHEPFIRPIVRGKEKAKTEFGPKLEISMEDGYARVEHFSFDPYNEASGLQESLERYKQRNGCYPKRVLADKLYRNRDNLQYCKQLGVRLSGPALGRPRKDTERNRKIEYLDMCERNEVEGKFGQGKRSYGLGLVTQRLPETIYTTIAMSLIVMNLNKVLLLLFTLLLSLIYFYIISAKTKVVQQTLIKKQCGSA